MSGRCQHTQELMPQIEEMLPQGMTQAKVAYKFGMEEDRPIRNLLK
jgi:hypothetical protein